MRRAFHALRRPHLADPHRRPGARTPRDRRSRRGQRGVRRRCGRTDDRHDRGRRGDGRAGRDEHRHRGEERADGANPDDRRRRIDRDLAQGTRCAPGRRSALDHEADHASGQRVKTVPSLEPTLERACQLAIEGVPGPVFIEVPVDLLYPEGFDPPAVRRRRRKGSHWPIGPCAGI